MVFKTSLCNVICHSVFITMPTGRTLLFPLIGKLKKKMTEKETTFIYIFFHSCGEQKMLWVYYLASCECRDVRPHYVFVCSDGRVIM